MNTHEFVSKIHHQTEAVRSTFANAWLAETGFKPSETIMVTKTDWSNAEVRVWFEKHNDGKVDGAVAMMAVDQAKEIMAKLEECAAQCDDLQRQLDTARENSSLWQSEALRLRGEHDQLQEARNEALASARSQLAENEQLSVELDEMQTKHLSLEAKCSELLDTVIEERRLRTLQGQENASLQESAAARLREINALRQQLEWAERQRDEALANYADLERNYADLAEERDRLRGENEEALAQRNEALQNADDRADHLIEEGTSARLHLSRLQVRFDELNASYDKLLEERDAAIGERDGTQRELAEMVRQRDTWHQSYTQDAVLHDHAATSLADMTRERDDLLALVKAVEKQRNDLFARLARAEENVLLLNASCEHLQAEVDRLGPLAERLAVPDFAALEDMRQSEMTPEQRDAALEGWIRKNAGWADASHHIPFLLRRIDQLRGVK